MRLRKWGSDMNVNFKKSYDDVWHHRSLISFCFHHYILEPVFRRIFSYGKLLNKHEFLVTADNYLKLLDDVEKENPVRIEAIKNFGVQLKKA